jgi:uncharacterized protein YkwD
MKIFAALVTAAVLLSACAAPEGPRFGPDGQPLPQIYRITARDEARIQFRMLDSINALRQAQGAQPLELNAELNAAAATHSRDMSVQNRPWNFGSDGSSPIVRVQRTGYSGRFIDEIIAETYETELQTLSGWMSDPRARPVILDPRANELGFAWFQEEAGKIWWTLITGQSGGFAPAPGF